MNRRQECQILEVKAGLPLLMAWLPSLPVPGDRPQSRAVAHQPDLSVNVVFAQFIVEQVKANQHPLTIGQIANNFAHRRRQNFSQSRGR